MRDETNETKRNGTKRNETKERHIGKEKTGQTEEQTQYVLTYNVYQTFFCEAFSEEEAEAEAKTCNVTGGNLISKVI